VPYGLDFGFYRVNIAMFRIDVGLF